MRIALCDDESICRLEINYLLNEYAREKKVDIICDQYHSGHDLIPLADKYDIIFLDYQMQEINGLDTARKIRSCNNKCVIIFVSAYPQIAMDAFEVNTFRFLTKPVNKGKFYKAIDDYLKSIDRDNLIAVKSGETTYMLNVSDIIYVEAKFKHCIIRTSDNTYETVATLKNIEKQLPEGKFARCQRAYIAGFKHIRNHTSEEILFDNGEKANIGRSYYSDFKNAFQDYIIKYNKGQL